MSTLTLLVPHSIACKSRNSSIPKSSISTYLLQTYKYDQLNRLTRMDVDTGFNVTTNSYAGIRPPGWSFNMFRERVSYDANGNIQKYLRASNAPMGYPTYSSVPMDSLHYVYYPGTNRLRQVRDSVPAGNFGSHDYDFVRDIDDQPVTDNYVYDEIGNMVKDSSEKITGIRWTVYGKIRDIYREATALNTTTHIRYDYDAQGNRIGSLRERSDGNKAYTWYVRDAQGNVMSTYAASGTGSNLTTDYGLGRTEVYTYGSSRLGVYNYEMNVDNGPADVAFFNSFGYLRGWRQYELTNHLGNACPSVALRRRVLTTISDKKIAVASDTNSSLIGYFNPDIVSAQDYYPFGMPMRVQPAASGRNYRFGFNGKEQDHDVKGWGNQQDYGMRIYDNRLGRFLSVDPLSKDYPHYTPYSFAGNKPIWAVDLDGLEESTSSKYVYKPFPALGNTPKSTADNTIAGLNLGSFKLNKQSYDLTTWWVPATKVGTFAENSTISAWNQGVDAVEFGSRAFTEKGRKQNAAKVFVGFIKLAMWWGGTSSEEKWEDIKEFGSDVNNYEDLTGSLLLSRAMSYTLAPTPSKIPLSPSLGRSYKFTYAFQYGKCVEFVSEFKGAFARGIKAAGGQLKTYEINIGKDGLIGTDKFRLADNGMHQFVEATVGNEVKIFDNFHPEGISKPEFMKLIEGFSREKGVIGGKELFEKYTKEITNGNP